MGMVEDYKMLRDDGFSEAEAKARIVLAWSTTPNELEAALLADSVKYLRSEYTVKCSKKAIRQLCENAEHEGHRVEHRVKGNTDNIYINGINVACTGLSFAVLIIRVKHDNDQPVKQPLQDEVQ